MGRTTMRIAACAAVLGLGACGDDGGASGTAVIDPGDGGHYEPVVEPAAFVDAITHPYLPLTPGTRWVYEGDDGTRVEVEVTGDRRTVMGISAVVVRDTEYEDGSVVEDTYDWFAQDSAGNVWYLGEDTKEYEDGEVVSTAGSWEAGVGGALPGILMPGALTPGAVHRQEFLRGEAEDMGELVRVGQAMELGATAYTDVVVFREWTPLEPTVVEEKYYAPGVGLVLAVKVAGGDGREELVSFTPG